MFVHTIYNININFHIGFPKNCLMVSSIAWSHGIALHNQRYTHSGQRRRAYPLQGKPYVSSFFTCTQKKTSYLYRHLTINISCTPNPPQLQCLVIRDGGECVWGGEGIHTHTHFLFNIAINILLFSNSHVNLSLCCARPHYITLDSFDSTSMRRTQHWKSNVSSRQIFSRKHNVQMVTFFRSAERG